MSKKRKMVRIPAMRSLQRVQTILPEVRAEVKPQERAGRSGRSAEYILQQYYTVVVEEQRIEEEWLSQFSLESRVRMQEKVARFQRMLRDIVADQKALHAVCTYLVLAEQDSLGDDATAYVTEYYEGEKSFIDILVAQVSCFMPEDRAWLLSLVDCDEEEDFDLDLQVEGLRMAFHLKTSGFHVGQHACRLEKI